MIILGLHGGHDASVAVIKDGIVISFVMRERLNRVKYSSGLDKETIQTALSDAKIKIDDIDFCAVTSTQNKEIISLDKNYLDFSFGNKDTKMPCSLLEEEKRGENDPIGTINYDFRDKLFESNSPESFPGYYYFPEWKNYDYKKLGKIGFICQYIKVLGWENFKKVGLNELDQFSLNFISDWERIRFGFHYPISVYLENQEIPSFMINHHLAHAASGYYVFPYDNGVILSHDGGIDRGDSFNSGFLLLAENNKIYPVIPHNLIIGHIYSYIGMKLGLGMMGQAGKLMGLSSYGKNNFLNENFIGNIADLNKRGYLEPEKDWFEYCSLKVGKNFKIPESKEELNKSHFCRNLAGSTQELFEKTIINTIKTFKNLLLKNKISNNNLFLTGGVALNCPTNTKLFKLRLFKNLLIPPWCNDTGLSLGAALYLYHNIMDKPLKMKKRKINVYYGRNEPKQSILETLNKHKDKVIWQEIKEGDIEMISEELKTNKIIGWFEDGSEVGPRALGHRSILANPMIFNNIEKINEKKGREKWRPFGAMVLEKESKKYFSDFPLPSPHMLFNAKVKNNKLLAITHVDNSSRIQTVTKKDGFFYNLLYYFFKKTGIPILLNTSFNRKGEPIVETTEDAIRSFLKMNLDFFYLVTGKKIIKVTCKKS